MKLWIAYDDSKERLPIAVADTSVALAKMVGVSPNTVKKVAKMHDKGVIKNPKYARVVVEDGECQ